MKQLLRMSASPVTALFALAFVGMATPQRRLSTSIARQDSVSGMRSCGFETMEQCQAMSSGRGGSCYRDPFLTDTSSAYGLSTQSISVQRSRLGNNKAVSSLIDRIGLANKPFNNGQRRIVARVRCKSPQFAAP